AGGEQALVKGDAVADVAEARGDDHADVFGHVGGDLEVRVPSGELGSAQEKAGRVVQVLETLRSDDFFGPEIAQQTRVAVRIGNRVGASEPAYGDSTLRETLPERIATRTERTDHAEARDDDALGHGSLRLPLVDKAAQLALLQQRPARHGREP